MGATDLIFKLRSDGYSIKADGGYLDIFPAEDLSPEFVKQLRQGKPEILCALRQEEELKRLDKKHKPREVATAIPATNEGEKRGKIATIASPKVAQIENKEVSNQAARKLSNEELQELSSLIEYVAAGNNFSAEDIIEAKSHATRDIENALTSFRALARDIRRDRVMELLQASPESLRAVHIDADSDPKNIVLTIALRNAAIAEMVVSRSRYDPWTMINILDGEVH